MNHDPAPITPASFDVRILRRKILLRLPWLPVVLALMLFLPAGTLLYWQGWVYIALLFIPMLLVLAYFLKHDPEVLERRLKSREKVKEQKLIIKLFTVVYIAAFLLPGFDRRFGWSSVPTALIIVAEPTALGGYFLFFLALRENRYASRIVEVADAQKVITTGPYALVRHPMYLGFTLLFLATPLALGSFWAMIPFAMVVLVLIPRILSEEKVLTAELEGYQEYKERVKYRLIPGIW